MRIHTSHYFDPRTSAILNDVWALNPEEKKLLNFYLSCECSVDDFLSAVQPPSDISQYADRIKFYNYFYHVKYCRTSVDQLEAICEIYKNTPVVFQLRASHAHKFFCCLVSKRDPRWPVGKRGGVRYVKYENGELV